MPPIKHRLDRKSFNILFKSGKKLSFPFFVLIYRRENIIKRESKFGFVISSKISKKAVVRNKLKRRTKAVILELLKNFLAPCRIIFIFKKECLALSFKELEAEIISAFKKIGIII